MTSVVLVAPLPIHADSEIAQSTPLSILFSRQRDAYAKDGTYSTYGVFFDQSRSFAISNVRSSPYPPFIDGKLDQSIWDWSLCSSSTDETCAINSDNYVTAESVLGICLNAEELGCIDEVNIKIKNGESEKLHLVAYTSVKGRLDVVVLMAGSHSQSSTIESELHSVQRLVTARGAQLVVFTLRNLLRGGTVTSSGVTPFERINVMIKRLTRPPKSEFTHIADWKEFSDGHSNWFRHDGIHLNIRGVVALGWYISSVVAHVVQAPCTTYETDICPMPTSANSRGDWLNRFRVKYTEIHCYEDGAMRRKICERDRRMP